MRRSPSIHKGPRDSSRFAILAAVAFLASTATAGCLDAKGSVEVRVSVADSEAFDDFAALSMVVRSVRVKAEGGNPETIDLSVTKMDLLGLAGGEPLLVATGRDILAGPQVRLDILVQLPEGSLKNDTTQQIQVVNNVLLFPFPYQIEKDKRTSLLATITLVKTNTTAGTSYTLVEDIDRSGVA